MNLSEMRDLLTRDGIQLTKSLGQNFLHDTNQLRRIADAAELSPSDKVLEVGPGLGPLTEVLLQRAGEILAIEKDLRLVQVLQERFVKELATSRDGTGAALSLHHDDALDLLQREKRDWSDWKLVANLPYSVASPILVELAQCPRPPERLVATLQLEVARRLMAQAGDDDYGVLTLLVQVDFEPRHWFRIPRTCFFPEPDVDSACVCLVRRPDPRPAIEQRQHFVQIVKRGFSQRRKMMLKLLKQDWSEENLGRAFDRLQLSPQVRAEALSLDQFVALTAELTQGVGPR